MKIREKMYNIVTYLPQSHSKYEKLYSLEAIKKNIVYVKTLADATQYKSKKVLIISESYDIDEGAVKLIAEKHKACFLIDISKIINSRGISRAVLLSRLRTFLKFCIKYNAYYTFADFAKDDFELRSPRELIHIAGLLGVNEGQTKFALKMIQHYTE